MAPRGAVRAPALLIVLVMAVAAVALGCSSPPQVLEISPQRGAVDVHSDEAISVRFDRPMDRASVASHFHVEPPVQGAMHWTGDQELAFEHVPFSPSSRYQVVLDPGYRDALGVVNSFRHSWSFQTEAAPVLAGSTPGAGDGGTDPAAYITLSFSREMDPGSLAGAIAVEPSVAFAIHQDPGDARRVILAPQSLLEARTGYAVTVGRDARDVHGNRLGASATVSFTTGDFRPLRHWISFIAETAAGSGDVGVWIVDENRLPRRLVSSAVSSFVWSADGTRLLLRSPQGAWTDQALDGAATSLPFHGTWADFLTPGDGYAFLDQGRLQLSRPDGTSVTVAPGVTDAAVAPGGGRLAYATRDPAGSERAAEIVGYDTELGTHYRLQTEPEPVDGLAWSPDGQSLAYRVDALDPARRQVRVLSLRDGRTVTVAAGGVSVPAWQDAHQHLVFTATAATAGGPAAKAYRVAVGGGSPAISTAAGMPGDKGIGVSSVSPSADGHQLAFISDAGGSPGVWTMNADGTGVAQLTDPDPNRFPYTCRALAWTPG